MGNLYKYFPLLAKSKAGNKGKSSPSVRAQTQAYHSDEAEQMDTDATGSRPASTTLKKHGKIHLQPPSPPLTRSKVVTGVALSSGMFIPNPCSASIFGISIHKGNTMGSQQNADILQPDLSHPIFPLISHVPVTSCTPPTTSEEMPWELNPPLTNMGT